MIDRNEFMERRRKIGEELANNSLFVSCSGESKIASSDILYPFEPSRIFYYLTGLDHRGYVLFIWNKGGIIQEELVYLGLSDDTDVFDGCTEISRDVIHITSGISAISNMNFEEFANLTPVPAINSFCIENKISKIFLAIEKELKVGANTFEKDLYLILPQLLFNVEISDGQSLVNCIRLIKTTNEIELIKRGINSTRKSLYKLFKHLRPGVSEKYLANVYSSDNYLDCDVNGLSFPPVVAAGLNAVVLHHTPDEKEIKAGSLVLLDVGSRCDFYCADVTRTIPVDGVFSDLQKTIYRIVLDCNKLIIQKAKPGIQILELNLLAIDFLSEQCILNGLISNKEDIDKHFYHGISHLIGLETHDPPPDNMCTRDLTLKEGMVISNEPGLYFSEYQIGIRIEDDLLITNKGCEVLTKGIIKEISEIEYYLTQTSHTARQC